MVSKLLISGAITSARVAHDLKDFLDIGKKMCDLDDDLDSSDLIWEDVGRIDDNPDHQSLGVTKMLGLVKVKIRPGYHRTRDLGKYIHRQRGCRVIFTLDFWTSATCSVIKKDYYWQHIYFQRKVAQVFNDLMSYFWEKIGPLLIPRSGHTGDVLLWSQTLASVIYLFCLNERFCARA